MFLVGNFGNPLFHSYESNYSPLSSQVSVFTFWPHQNTLLLILFYFLQLSIYQVMECNCSNPCSCSHVPEGLVPHISCDAFHIPVTLLKSGNENPRNDWTLQVYQHFFHSNLCPFGTICNNRQSTKSNSNLGMSQSAR